MTGNRGAVFTIVQDELELLPIWLGYYLNHFPSRDVYVLDHGTEGCGRDVLEDLRHSVGFNYLQVQRTDSYDDRWLCGVCSDFQRYLLRSYRMVLFAAVDEIVTAAPHCDNLASFMQSSMLSYSRCAGYELVHRHDQEPELDLTKPLLRQRQWWYPSQRYSKPLLARTPMYWRDGFSHARNTPATWPRSAVLRLIHLHKMDLQHVMRRHRLKASRRWDPQGRLDGPYRHNHLDDPEKLQRWILSNADDTSKYAELTPIPEELRDLL